MVRYVGMNVSKEPLSAHAARCSALDFNRFDENCQWQNFIAECDKNRFTETVKYSILNKLKC
jgi:hypothetical protein